MGPDGRIWRVQAVFGCDKHPGPGFAYTIGLAARGLLELHMWDRPTHGDDPGADFALSSSDLGLTLNEYADEWVAGTLRTGDVRELSLDDGLTTAVITVGEPVDADEVEAWGARPSLVVPLRWSLHRPPRGEPVPILDDARDAYERDVRATAATSDRRVRVSGALVPEGAVTFDVDGLYGPLSALVEAHALAMAATPRIGVLVENALAAETAMSPKALLGRMTTLSRLSGRDEQVAQAGRLAVRVMDRLENRRAWRDHVVVIAGECGRDRRRTSMNLRDLVATAFRCALVGLALDDVLPGDMVLASQGPWRAVLSSTGADPGQRWRCSAEAERTVRRSFASLDAHGLLDLARLMRGPVADLLDDDLMILNGRALTRRLAPPPVTDVVRTQVVAAASFPPVLEQLSLAAQLIVAMQDDPLALDEDRSMALANILEPWIDDSWEGVA